MPFAVTVGICPRNYPVGHADADRSTDEKLTTFCLIILRSNASLMAFYLSVNDWSRVLGSGREALVIRARTARARRR
jgi:hypothetical protein